MEARALEVSQIGLGCMGPSEFYGRSDEGEAIATIRFEENVAGADVELTAGGYAY